MKKNLFALFLLLTLFSSCFLRNPGGISQNEKVYSQRLGPAGEEPISLEELEEILSNVRKSHQDYQIALAMHDLNNDWSMAVVEGIEFQLGQMGMELALITDGEFDLEKQMADIRYIMNRSPDLLISLPLDTFGMEDLYREIADRSIPMVFIDSVPQGLTAPDDYKGWAVGDAYRMGQLGAEALMEACPVDGQVALLHWQHSMFTVDERSRGAIDFFQAQDKVRVVSEIYFDEFHEIDDRIEELMDGFPEISGIWTVWDTPAFEVYDALEGLNKEVYISTCDLSMDMAQSMKEGGLLVGSGVDHPFDQGRAVALLGLAALEDIDVPSYCVIYAEKAELENLEDVWQRMYHKDLMLD